jgi:hypothetical protein
MVYVIVLPTDPSLTRVKHDLATAPGTHIDISLLSDHPSLPSSQSREHKIRQDRPKLAVWRKACSLGCDTKSGKLHQPLRPWLLPSVSLRRTWPFHGDHSSGKLLVRWLQRSSGPESCAISSLLEPDHSDPSELLFTHGNSRDSIWISPPRWSLNH